MIRATLGVLSLACVAGCGVEPLLQSTRSIDVSALTDGRDVRGLSLDGDLIDLVIEGRGIVQIDRDGQLVTSIERGERGLWDVDYKDVAAKGDDVFVLLSDNEGYLYDATTEQQRVHFCVEPGFEEEPWIEEPVVTQRNDAVTVRGNLIVAAPRFYSDGRLTESSLRTYRAVDGELLSSVDHASLGLELRGLAMQNDAILGVQDDELHTFDLAGAHEGLAYLDGVSDAGGLAYDEETNELFVADGDDSIVVFANQ